MPQAEPRDAERRGTRHVMGGGSLDDAIWLVVLLVGLTLLAILPLVPWYLAMDTTHIAINVLHASLCAAGAAVSVYRGLRPCLLVASTFPYCWLVVASAYQLSHQQAAWADPGVLLDYSSVVRAQLVLCLGQLCLLVGYALSASKPRPRVDREPMPEWVQSRLLVAAAIALTGAVALVPLVISSAGGLGALFRSRDEFNSALAQGGLDSASTSLGALIKIVPSSLAVVAGLLTLWLIWTVAPGDSRRRRALLVAAVAGGLLFVVANPFAFTRYLVLACFGAYAAALFRPRSRRAALLWLCLAQFAFLLAYPFAEIFRRGSGAAPATGPLLASKDFDGFQQTINTVTYVSDNGVTWGHHIFSGLLFFVPRAIWTDKAVPSAFPVAEARGYTFQNLSEPFPAEAYLDFGWAGVVVLMLLLGWVWHVLDRAWGNSSRLSILTAYIFVAQVGIWRGPFGSLVPIFGFTMIVLVGALLVSSASPPRARPPGPGQADRIPALNPGRRGRLIERR